MSILVLNWNDNRQLGKKYSIRAQELRCKCGGKHNITVNTLLIDKLETLMDIVGAKHIYFSSVNRCKVHDKNVGGSGWGLHTISKAADFKMTDEKDKAIDTRVLAAVMQEIGFTGIGRITKDYIHGDVGTLAEHGGKKWLGDEMVKGGTSGSVINEPNTYWNYYGLKRSDYIKTPVEPIEKRLQRVLNAMGEKLDVDGIVGENTMKALKRHNISKGEKGEFIKIIQEILNAKGYDAGEPDGIAGDKTIQAICNAAWDKLF